MSVLQRVASDLEGNVNGEWAEFCRNALSHGSSGTMAHVTPTLEAAASRVEFFALIMGEANALIGRSDDAIKWTRTAVDRGFINYPFLAQHSQFLNPIRDDSRFQQLLVELRPRWEAVVAWERSL
jgi:hypothetical protein